MLKTYSNNIKQTSGIFLLIFTLALTTIPQSANGEVAWSDDFEGDFDDWQTMSYHSNTSIWTGLLSASDSVFTIADGALTSPHFDEFKDSAHAYHDSTHAYGTWSFDWQVSSDMRSFDSIEFMFSDPKNNFNWSGVYGNDKGIAGYALTLGSYDESRVDSTTPGLNLVKLSNIGGIFSPSNLKSHSFDDAIEGSHHIDITRSTDGEFKVFFDSDLIIQVTDNAITTSEKFGFTSWIGASSIDNLEVSDTVDVSEEEDSPVSVWFLFPTLVILALKRKTIKR
ncbi:MAG: hypothetical protein ACXAD7_24585 [Candidatus Kariarchaeaceae archaeon]|jgi:hypothetical protein